MRRAGLVLVLVGVVTLVSTLPALGQDLEDWLDRAAQAEYRGRQFTVCDTPDGARVELVEVSQRDGLLEVRAAQGRAVVGPEGMYERDASGAAAVTSTDSHHDWRLAERYRVEFGEPDEVLNRPVDVLKVLEGDLTRMHLAFDRGSGAVVEAIVMNGDATRYCTSSFVRFEASTPPISRPAMVADVIESAVVDSDRLPESLAGFERKDAFDGPAGSVSGFYSDGLFSFTLVSADRRITVQGMPDTTPAFVGGAIYDRAFTAGQSYHAWESPGGGYVMLGDLPLDLQERVLAELPKPGKPGFLVRIWRRIFG